MANQTELQRLRKKVGILEAEVKGLRIQLARANGERKEPPKTTVQGRHTRRNLWDELMLFGINFGTGISNEQFTKHQKD